MHDLMLFGWLIMGLYTYGRMMVCKPPPVWWIGVVAVPLALIGWPIFLGLMSDQ